MATDGPVRHLRCPDCGRLSVTLTREVLAPDRYVCRAASATGRCGWQTRRTPGFGWDQRANAAQLRRLAEANDGQLDAE